MIDNDHPTLVLASASPRRRKLLALLGLPFEVLVAGIPETPGNGEAPLAYVRRVAREKAEAVSTQSVPFSNSQPLEAQPATLIIAADTEVVFEGDVLGKPNDADAARQMLERLRGRTHQVISVVVVKELRSGRTAEVVCQSDVPMRDYSEAELEAYVESGDPFDKAGGYAIQHDDFHPVESFGHCYASVMGFPLCHLAVALRRLGVQLNVDVATACQQFLNYECPVHAEILTSP
jgi:MAF protein